MAGLETCTISLSLSFRKSLRFNCNGYIYGLWTSKLIWHFVEVHPYLAGDGVVLMKPHILLDKKYAYVCMYTCLAVTRVCSQTAPERVEKRGWNWVRNSSMSCLLSRVEERCFCQIVWEVALTLGMGFGWVGWYCWAQSCYMLSLFERSSFCIYLGNISLLKDFF